MVNDIDDANFPLSARLQGKVDEHTIALLRIEERLVKVEAHTAALLRIEEQLDTLREIAQTVRGLRLVGKLMVWVGGVATGAAVLFQIFGA